MSFKPNRGKTWEFARLTSNAHSLRDCITLRRSERINKMLSKILNLLSDILTLKRKRFSRSRSKTRNRTWWNTGGYRVPTRESSWTKWRTRMTDSGTSRRGRKKYRCISRRTASTLLTSLKYLIRYSHLRVYLSWEEKGKRITLI